jgi:flagellin-like hook-associated protein FlgL
MDRARTLVTGGIDDMRSIHGTVASNISQMDTTKELHTTFINNANAQIDDIQGADAAEVTTKISFAQAQLQASYSVTGKIASLSLVNYLS